MVTAWTENIINSHQHNTFGITDMQKNHLLFYFLILLVHNIHNLLQLARQNILTWQNINKISDNFKNL